MKIIESIYNEPHKWRVERYTFCHEDGLRIWIENGFFFYNTHPESSWSLLMKVRFARAFRWWSENRPVSMRKDK